MSGWWKWEGHWPRWQKVVWPLCLALVVLFTVAWILASVLGESPLGP